jgi:2-hydroxychromene-2-carboxylate isomerase
MYIYNFTSPIAYFRACLQNWATFLFLFTSPLGALFFTKLNNILLQFKLKLNLIYSVEGPRVVVHAATLLGPRPGAELEEHSP